LRLAKLRRSATQYLLDGTLLRPPKLEVAKARIQMSRLSIYAGQRGGLQTFEKQAPLAMAAAWQAPDGHVAIALASISHETLPVRLRIPTLDYGLPNGGEITQLDLEGRKRIGQLAAPETTLRLKLPPRGACILELGQQE